MFLRSIEWKEVGPQGKESDWEMTGIDRPQGVSDRVRLSRSPLASSLELSEAINRLRGLAPLRAATKCYSCWVAAHPSLLIQTHIIWKWTKNYKSMNTQVCQYRQICSNLPKVSTKRKNSSAQSAVLILLYSHDSPDNGYLLPGGRSDAQQI